MGNVNLAGMETTADRLGIAIFGCDRDGGALSGNRTFWRTFGFEDVQPHPASLFDLIADVDHDALSEILHSPDSPIPIQRRLHLHREDAQTPASEPVIELSATIESGKAIGTVAAVASEGADRSAIDRSPQWFLDSIRAIRRAVPPQTDTQGLVSVVCRILVDTAGYSPVWAVLTDGARAITGREDNRTLEAVFERAAAGKEESVPTPCMREARRRGAAIVWDPQSEECGDCPMLQYCIGYDLVYPVMHGDRYLGAVVAMADRAIPDPERERQVFAEIPFELGPAVARLWRAREQETRLRELQDHSRLVEAIRWMQSDFIARKPLKEICESLLARALELTESPIGFVNLVEYDEQGQPYMLCAAISDISWDEESRRFYREVTERGFEFRDLSYLPGSVVRTRRPVIANEAANHPDSRGLPPGHPTLTRFAGLPMIDRGRLIGVIGLANRAQPYEREQIDWLQPLLDTVAGIIEASRQETARSEAERALRESEERFELMFRNAPMAYQSLDEDGRLLEVNQAWLDLMQITREDALGRSWGDFMGPDDQALFAQRFPQFKEQGRVAGVQFCMRRGDGREVLVEAVGRISRKPDGSFLQTHCILQDVTELEAARHALVESEQRYRLLVEHSPDPISVSREGRILMVNKRAVELFGAQREDDLIGRHIMELLHPDEHEKVRQRLQAVEEGRRPLPPREQRAIGLDGRQLNIEVNAISIPDKDGAIILSIIRDVTARKHATRREFLRSRLAYLLNTVESFKAALSLVLDIALELEGVDSGSVLYYDDDRQRFASREHRGVSQEYGDQVSTIGADHPIFDRLHAGETVWGEYTGIAAQMDEVRRKEGITHVALIPIRYRNRTLAVLVVATHAERPIPDGVRAFLEEEAQRLGAILARLKADEARARSEEDLRGLISAIPDMIFRLDAQGRYADYHLPKGSAPYVPPEVFLGRHPREVMPAEIAELAEAARIKAIETGEVQTIQYQLPKGEEQELRQYESRLAACGEGEVIVIVRDITEIKRAEAERSRIERLESLGLLAGGISHDFNNVLAGIVSNLTLLREELHGRGDLQQMVRETEEAALNARRLTAQLQTFSRGGKPVKERLDLARLLTEQVRFALSGSNVVQAVEVADDNHWIEADAGQLGQVFSNIAINAKQAMPQGGPLRVALDYRVLKEGEAAQLSLVPGRYAVIRFTDRGTGILPEHLPFLFDPYFTTKQHGSGLGLAVTHSIVTAHKGRMTVESELGKGTTFEVWLPAAPIEQPSLRPETPQPQSSLKILILEDDPLIRRNMSRLLERHGYRVSMAVEGGEALEQYRESLEAGQPFDVAVLDLTIPKGMGGLECMQRLREVDPQVRAVVCSGYDDESILNRHAEYGFLGVLTKPYRIEELVALIENAVSAKN